MHMADALVSPAVAGTAGAVAVVLIGIASQKVKRIRRDDIVPLMGIMGAFVFAAQMINFSIPGTGSSGHIIGGVLLAALMGPWAAFLTLSSVLMIQCLIFADGGLMALGCNVLNMAAMSCLVAYPFFYRPISGKSVSVMRLWVASIVACIAGLECGAFLVTAETELSGVTALSAKGFLTLMTSIHLAIGLCEGIATALVLTFVASYKPDMLYGHQNPNISAQGVRTLSKQTRIVLWSFAGVALLLAAVFTWIASGDPDGLEWSIMKLTGKPEIEVSTIPSTAVIPDYDSTFAGIIGGAIVMIVIWSVCALLFRRGHRVVDE